MKKLITIKKPELMMISSAIALAITLNLLSCKKEFPCDRASLILSFAGKTEDSLSSFTLLKYAKGMTSAAPTDSIHIANGNGVYFQKDGNSINVFFPNSLVKIEGAYDWKFKLYSASIENGQHEVIVSEITDNQETMKCKTKSGQAKGDCECMNKLLSYKKNGVSLSGSSNIEYNGITGYKTVINP